MNLTAVSSSHHRWWPVAVAALLLSAALALALAPLGPVLHSQWTEVATYSHGYLLLPVIAWLIWRVCRTRPPPIVRPDWWYALPLAIVLALLALLEVLYLNVPRLFLLPPLLIACTAFVFGRASGAIVFWPLVLLYSALPVWEAINGFLQSLTTYVVSAVLQATAVPAFIEGNFVRLPSGVFEIAEDCSGLKYLITGMALALISALAFLTKWRQRTILLAVTLLSLLVCNWVRVYVVILVGYRTEMQHSLVAEHTALGWILFVVFMAPIMWLMLRSEPPSKDSESSSRPPTSIESRNVIVAAVVAALLLGIMRATEAALLDAGAPSPGRLAILGDGHEVPTSASPWQPQFRNAHELRAQFPSGSTTVEVFVAAYPRQDANHRVIAYENSFVPESWRPVAERRRHVATRDTMFEVNELEGYIDGTRRLVWGWYSVAGEIAAWPLRAKVLELEGLFAGRRDAAAIAVSTECSLDDCKAARMQLETFVVNDLRIAEWQP